MRPLLAAQLLLLAVTSWSSAAAQLSNLNQAQVSILRSMILAKIKSISSVDAFGNRYFPLIAGCVRLSFHACVGNKCGGCLNLNIEANNGLNLTVYALEDVLQAALSDSRFSGAVLTRADLWPLCGAVAFELAAFKPDVDLTGVPNVTVVFGRQDCPTTPLTTGEPPFPDRRWSIDQVLAYFAGLGFNARDTVALMGAHSVGVVRDIGTSAIKAQWDHTPGAASVEFYQFLLQPTTQWPQACLQYTAVPQPICSFSRNGNVNTSIMLDTDVALVANLTISNPVTGQSSCSFTSCPQSSTIGFVQQYAANATGWLIDFIHAFNNLTARGYSSGALYAAPA